VLTETKKSPASSPGERKEKKKNLMFSTEGIKKLHALAGARHGTKSTTAPEKKRSRNGLNGSEKEGLTPATDKGRVPI